MTLKTEKQNEIVTSDVYVIQQTISHCKICDNENDLRNGICFDCAEAESIIVDGVDMYEKGLQSDGVRSFTGDKGKPAETAFEKIELLIAKGWRLQK